MRSNTLFVLARILIASVFIGLGAERLLTASSLLGGHLSSNPMVWGFAIFEFGAGLAIAFGWQARWVGLLMAIFLAADAWLSHPFWLHSGPALHGQLLHFLKNVSAIGGLLMLAWAETLRRSGRR